MHTQMIFIPKTCSFKDISSDTMATGLKTQHHLYEKVISPTLTIRKAESKFKIIFMIMKAMAQKAHLVVQLPKCPSVDSHRPAERALNILLTVQFFTRFQQLLLTQVWKTTY